MKKTFYFVFSICFIYYILLMYLEYSNHASAVIEDKKIQVIINMPTSRMTNSEFVIALKELAQTAETDIMYLITDHSQERVQKKYYVTTYTDDFTGIKNVQSILKEYNVITNSKSREDDSYYLGSSNLFYDTYIYKFDDIVNLNLLSCIYFIDIDKSDDFIKLLSDNFNIKVLNSINVSISYLSVRNVALPFILYLSSLLFYILSKRREIVIKKMAGYSNINVVADIISGTLKDIMVIISFILLVNILIMNILYPGCTYNYLDFIKSSLLIIILIILISLFLASVFVVFVKSPAYLKGKNDSLNFYLISTLIKTIFLFFAIIRLSDVTMAISSIYKLNKINTEISTHIKDYYAFPISGNETVINAENQLEFNRRLDLFYADTVNEYDGILINTRNYMSVSLDRYDTLAYVYGQNGITVNENYLKINEINTPDNVIIDKKMFKKDKLNLILPEGMEKQPVIDKYMYTKELEADEINILYYKKGEIIRSLHPYSGRWNNGLIENPVIEVYNNEFLRDQVLNYVSGQYYLIRLTDDEPYKEIKPLLIKYGLETVMQQAISVSNVFDNSISNISRRMYNDVAMALLYVISLIFLIIYNCKLFFGVCEYHIVYKRLSGYGLFEIYLLPLCLIIIIGALILGISAVRYLNRIIIIITIVAEIAVFILSALQLSNRKMIRVMKGEDK